MSKPTTVDEYIAGFPPDVRKVLEEVRQTVRKVVPDATEAIKYNMPTFVLGGNLVHFAGYKNHIGFYPAPSPDNNSFGTDLAGYKMGRGSIQFPLADPMPLDIITRIVEWRLENLGKESES